MLYNEILRVIPSQDMHLLLLLSIVRVRFIQSPVYFLYAFGLWKPGKLKECATVAKQNVKAAFH